MGVVEDVTVSLADAGLNILHLESNLGEKNEAGTYYIHLEGTLSGGGLSPIYQVLEKLEEKGIKSQLIPVNAQVS